MYLDGYYSLAEAVLDDAIRAAHRPSEPAAALEARLWLLDDVAPGGKGFRVKPLIETSNRDYLQILEEIKKDFRLELWGGLHPIRRGRVHCSAIAEAIGITQERISDIIRGVQFPVRMNPKRRRSKVQGKVLPTSVRRAALRAIDILDEELTRFREDGVIRVWNNRPGDHEEKILEV